MRRFSWFPRLPRRVRIVRNFLAALLLLAAVVLALGVPPLSPVVTLPASIHPSRWVR